MIRSIVYALPMVALVAFCLVCAIFGTHTEIPSGVMDFTR